jgi:small subunit ribosomal protein S18
MFKKMTGFKKGDRKPGPRDAMKRMRIKHCRLCAENKKDIDYKDLLLLQRYHNSEGKMIPSKRSGACMHHQRMLAQAIKRARTMALVPYVS